MLRFKLRMVIIDVRYHYRIFKIVLRREYNLKRVALAGKLLKWSGKVCPEVLQEYERTIARRTLDRHYHNEF